MVIIISFCVENVVRTHAPDSKPAYNVKSIYDILYTKYDSDEINATSKEPQKQKLIDDSTVSLLSLAPMEPHKYLSLYDVAVRKQGILLFYFFLRVSIFFNRAIKYFLFVH